MDEQLDLVRIFRGRHSWSWQRLSPQGHVVAESTMPYLDHEDALGSALSCCDEPYMVLVELPAA